MGSTSSGIESIFQSDLLRWGGDSFVVVVKVIADAYSWVRESGVSSPIVIAVFVERMRNGRKKYCKWSFVKEQGVTMTVNHHQKKLLRNLSLSASPPQSSLLQQPLLIIVCVACVPQVSLFRLLLCYITYFPVATNTNCED